MVGSDSPSVSPTRRQTVLDEALVLAAERATPLKDLLISITAARQVSGVVFVGGSFWGVGGVGKERYLCFFVGGLENPTERFLVIFLVTVGFMFFLVFDCF